MERPIKLSALITLMLGTGIALLAFLTAFSGNLAWAGPQRLADAGSANTLPSAPPANVATTAPGESTLEVIPVADNPGLLDGRRLFALGMIETGNDDREVGGLGEVSRYQIMPSVWSQYNHLRHYNDPKTSKEVASQHWTALRDSFKRQAHREPTDFDMYVLWNTRYGYYARHEFKPDRLSPTIRDRAQRFVNLVQRGAS